MKQSASTSVRVILAAVDLGGICILSRGVTGPYPPQENQRKKLATDVITEFVQLSINHSIGRTHSGRCCFHADREYNERFLFTKEFKVLLYYRTEWCYLMNKSSLVLSSSTRIILILV